MFVIRWKQEKDHVASYFSGTMSMPGFGRCPVWDDLADAKRYKTEAAATRDLHAVGRYGKGYSVVALADAQRFDVEEKEAARKAKAAREAAAQTRANARNSSRA